MAENGGLTLDIDIDPERLERAFVESVLQTGMGDLINSHKSVIEQAVKNVIANEVRDVIEREYKDRIREKLSEHLTDDVISEMVGSIWRKALTTYT